MVKLIGSDIERLRQAKLLGRLLVLLRKNSTEACLPTLKQAAAPTKPITC